MLILTNQTVPTVESMSPSGSPKQGSPFKQPKREQTVTFAPKDNLGHGKNCNCPLHKVLRSMNKLKNKVYIEKINNDSKSPVTNAKSMKDLWDILKQDEEANK